MKKNIFILALLLSGISISAFASHQVVIGSVIKLSDTSCAIELNITEDDQTVFSAEDHVRLNGLPLATIESILEARMNEECEADCASGTCEEDVSCIVEGINDEEGYNDMGDSILVSSNSFDTQVGIVGDANFDDSNCASFTANATFSFFHGSDTEVSTVNAAEVEGFGGDNTGIVFADVGESDDEELEDEDEELEDEEEMDDEESGYLLFDLNCNFVSNNLGQSAIILGGDECLDTGGDEEEPKAGEASSASTSGCSLNGTGPSDNVPLFYAILPGLLLLAGLRLRINRANSGGSSLLGIALLALMSISGTACFEVDDFWDEDSYSGGGSDSGDSTEDLLLVTESSEEEILLEYNTLAFAALFNWEDGNHYFSPDPDGSLTGNRIVCAAAITQYEITGDCFRDGRVCHFEFYNDYSDIEGKDAYYLSDSSCAEGPGVGPFLVPLSSSPCGQDPFPACPSDDLFPDGFSEPEESEEDSGTCAVETCDDLSVTKSLIDVLCSAASRCDPENISFNDCQGEMQGDAGREIWDNFGLEDEENGFTTADVSEGLADGEVVVNGEALEECLHEITETCDNEGEAVDVGTYENVENLVPEEGPCPSVFTR